MKKNSRQSDNVEIQDKSISGKIKENIKGFTGQILSGDRTAIDKLTGYEDNSYTKFGLKPIQTQVTPGKWITKGFK